MDEDEFKSAYEEVNDAPCAFAKAVLRRCCGCSRAQRVYIAEREAVACKSPRGLQRCTQVLDRLRHNSLFALRLTHIEGSLPHAKEMKVQCGGLLGLQSALSPGHTVAATVEDINGLIQKAIEHYESLDRLPYREIVKHVTTYQVRHGRNHHGAR